MDIVYIGGKIDLDSGNIKYYRDNRGLFIEFSKKIINLGEYKSNKNRFSSEIKIDGDNIVYVSGDDLYLYEISLDNLEKLIYSRNDILYVGLNIKDEKKVKLREQGTYILSPSKKIKFGNGKIETDFGSIILTNEKPLRILLNISDGIIIRNSRI